MLARLVCEYLIARFNFSYRQRSFTFTKVVSIGPVATAAYSRRTYVQRVDHGKNTTNEACWGK